jgi:hypothetical protein
MHLASDERWRERGCSYEFGEEGRAEECGWLRRMVAPDGELGWQGPLLLSLVLPLSALE